MEYKDRKQIRTMSNMFVNLPLFLVPIASDMVMGVLPKIRSAIECESMQDIYATVDVSILSVGPHREVILDLLWRADDPGRPKGTIIMVRPKELSEQAAYTVELVGQKIIEIVEVPVTA